MRNLGAEETIGILKLPQADFFNLVTRWRTTNYSYTRQLDTILNMTLRHIINIHILNIIL